MRVVLLLAIIMFSSGSVLAAGGGKSLDDVSTSNYRGAPIHVDREEFAQGGVKKYSVKREQDMKVCEAKRDQSVKES